jgi:hypothetical protein
MSGDVRTVRVDVFAATRDDLNRFDPIAGPAAIDWPFIDSTEWASGLDRLVAEILGDSLSEFGDHELVFPDQAAGDWEGPWLVRVPEDVVEAFAALSYDDITQYANRAGLPADVVERVIALRELCRQARDDRRDVYQWSTE